MGKYILIVILLAGMFVFGCGSGSNSNSPVTPSLSNPAAQSCNSHSLWGLWEVNIDPTGGQGAIEVVPLRGAVFNANVQMFLTPPKAPINLLTFQLMPETDLPSGYVKVRVGLAHPFPGTPQYRGFDVRGIAMFGSNTVDVYNSDIMYGMPLANGQPSDVGYVLNPDGYTRWWNAPEFIDPLPLLSYKPCSMGTELYPSSTLNPYKYFADDFESDAPVSSIPPETRGTFSTSGSVNTRDYEIQFPIDPLEFKFNLAIDASWAEPDPEYEPQGYPVEAYPPDAQTQEPFHIDALQTGGDAFYNDGIYGGSIDLEVTVYDWQLAESQTDEMLELTSLWLSGAPLLSPVDIYPIATITPGPNTVSSVFEVEIESGMIDFTSSGEFMVLGTAESTEPNTYQPQLDGGENFIFPDGILSAYFMAKLTISGDVPTFIIEVPNGGEAWAVNSEQTIEWSGGEAFDYVRIEYSKDDFVSDVNEIVSSTPNSGTYLWESVPDDVSDTVKVRVSSADFPGVYDDTDEYFAIIESLWERIVYASDNPAGGGGRQIWSIDPEGLTEPVQWSHEYTAIFNECPKLSPCGNYILYASVGWSNANIMLIDINTGEETNITPSGYQCVYGDFSHDGTRIVSAMTTGPWYGSRNLYTFDYSGGNVTLVHTAGDDVWAPEFSYDDSKIVYQDFSDSQLYIYDYASDSISQYTYNTTWNDCPHFSPDDTLITWATMYGMGTGRHIWASPVESWNPPDYMVDFSTYIRSPCFSLDGEQIVFDWGSFDGSELAVYTVATDTYENITSNPWGDYQPDWGYMIPH